MNKWYFGIPLVALVAFFIYYLQFDKEYQADLKQKEAAHKQEMEAKTAAERAARLQAVEEAKKQIDARKLEQAANKALKEAEDAKREEERIAQERAKTDQSRINVELKDVREELVGEERLLKNAQELKRQHEQEREHVLGYNDAARKNRERFLGLIEKIDLAEKAKAEAAVAAAAAAKK